MRLAAGFTFQLPSERDGLRPMCTSSERQAYAEADAGGVPPGFRAIYVELLLERRTEQEAVRAAKRAQREARWRDIGAGLRAPLSPVQVDALWSDKPDDRPATAQRRALVASVDGA